MRSFITPTSKTAKPFLELQCDAWGERLWMYAWFCYADIKNSGAVLARGTSSTTTRECQANRRGHFRLVLVPLPRVRGRSDRFAIEKMLSAFSCRCLCLRTIETSFLRANGSAYLPHDAGKGDRRRTESSKKGGLYSFPQTVDEVPLNKNSLPFLTSAKQSYA